MGLKVAIGGFLVSCVELGTIFFFKMAGGKSKHIELPEELGEESGRNRDINFVEGDVQIKDTRQQN